MCDVRNILHHGRHQWFYQISLFIPSTSPSNLDSLSSNLTGMQRGISPARLCTCVVRLSAVHPSQPTSLICSSAFPGSSSCSNSSPEITWMMGVVHTIWNLGFYLVWLCGSFWDVLLKEISFQLRQRSLGHGGSCQGNSFPIVRYSQPRWLSGLRRSHVHSLTILVNWETGIESWSGQ